MYFHTLGYETAVKITDSESRGSGWVDVKWVDTHGKIIDSAEYQKLHNMQTVNDFWVANYSFYGNYKTFKTIEEFKLFTQSQKRENNEKV